MIRPGLPPTPASRGCSPRPPGRSPPAEPRPCHRAAHQALHVAIRGEHARNLSGFPTAPYRAHPSRPTVPRFDPLPEAKPPASGRTMLHRVDHHHSFRAIGSQRSPASPHSERSDLPRLSRWSRPRVEGDRKLQPTHTPRTRSAHTHKTAKVVGIFFRVCFYASPAYKTRPRKSGKIFFWG